MTGALILEPVNLWESSLVFKTPTILPSSNPAPTSSRCRSNSCPTQTQASADINSSSSSYISKSKLKKIREGLRTTLLWLVIWNLVTFGFWKWSLLLELQSIGSEQHLDSTITKDCQSPHSTQIIYASTLFPKMLKNTIVERIDGRSWWNPFKI